MILFISLLALQDPPKQDDTQARVVALERRVAFLERTLKEVLGKEKWAQVQADTCANNLRLLWIMQMNYCIQFGGRTKSMPKETGPAFWLALTKTQPPLIDETELDSLVCPQDVRRIGPGGTSYRGPKEPVGKLEGGDPVGCCEPGCHPDKTINVIRKSGEVIRVGPDDPLYKRAMETTSAK